MFFISWGSATKFFNLGAAGQFWCRTCEKDRNFITMLRYRVHHILWLFRWITGKTYSQICEVCSHGHELDKAEVEASLEKSPIPVIDRLGWAVGAGAVAILGAGAAVADSNHKVEETQFLAKPHVGDIYEVDIAKLLKNPEKPVMLSAMRVTSVQDGRVEMQMPKGFYDDLRGVQKDVSNGKAASEDYYTSERESFTTAGLKKMQDDKVILDVIR